MIKERLLILPQFIYNLKINLIDKQKELEDIKEGLANWELQELDDISNSTDDNGKPIFSNETKRKAELERRKIENGDYFIKDKGLDDLLREVKKQEIELDRLYNEQSNLRAICRLEGEN